MKLSDALVGIVKPACPDSFRDDLKLTVVEVDGVKYYYDLAKSGYDIQDVTMILGYYEYTGHIDPIPGGTGYHIRMEEPYKCTAKPPEKMKKSG